MGRRAGAQPVGDATQELVAGSVAEGVVDGLEVVEIDEEDGGPHLLQAGIGRECLVQALEEERPGAKASQNVVKLRTGGAASP